eukprot:COSAG06_NODE_549_length_14405_cov_6.391933_5_plen_56_part_00
MMIALRRAILLRYSQRREGHRERSTSPRWAGGEHMAHYCTIIIIAIADTVMLESH